MQQLALALAALLALASLAGNASATDPLPLLRYHSGGRSNREFGVAVGSRFKVTIEERLDASATLLAELRRYFLENDAPGKSVYAQFLDLHNDTFPQYVQEIEGLAEGSECFRLRGQRSRGVGEGGREGGNRADTDAPFFPLPSTAHTQAACRSPRSSCST